MQSLKITMKELEMKTCSISKSDNGMDDLSWETIEHALVETFHGDDYYFSIYSNDSHFPDEAGREIILQEYHDSVTGGHHGITKLYKSIRKHFFWKNMKGDIDNFIKSCKSFQENKLNRNKTRQPMIITDTPQSALDKIQMDIVDPLPITNSNNEYLLTIQCDLTKYADAIPIPNMEAITVATALA